MKRVVPAIGLFFIAPLVAEYLLGDLPINLLGALIVLAPMYGGGALLIRELVRRNRLGWPSIFTLALAYGIFEEGFTTQSLFNPNYYHLHLLRIGYIPALGISGWWTMFVLTLHAVWSIPVSIALAESLVPDRARTPWLQNAGLTIVSLLFVLGALASAAFSLKSDPFHATKMQFAMAAICCIAIVVVSFMLPSAREPEVTGATSAVNPWIVGAAALIAGSVFVLAPPKWAWGAVAIYVALDVLAIAVIHHWSRSNGWNQLHRIALAGGAGLVYAWSAFTHAPLVGKSILTARISHVVFAAALVVVLAVAAGRIQPTASSLLICLHCTPTL